MLTILNSIVIVNADQNRESSNADAYTKDSETESMFRCVREDSEQHCISECCGPRWYGVKLRLNRIVAIALNDSRSEVSVSVSWNNETKVHEASDNDLVVLEDIADVLGGDGSLDGRATLILLKSSCDIGLLVVAEPFGVFWEARDEEEEQEGDGDCERAFEDDCGCT